MVMTMSASRTASATLAARPAAGLDEPSATAGWLRLTPMTVWPALTRWPAIGPPMMPRPMKAMVLKLDLLSEGGTVSAATIDRAARRGCRAVVVAGMYSRATWPR